MNVTVDYTRDSLISPYAMRILKDRYMVEGEKSPQDAFARAAAAFADDEAHAQRLYDYVSKQWFMFSTPVLANGGTKRGLPISCYLQYTPDSRDGIFKHWEEAGWLASQGGGLGAAWSDLRTNKTKTSSGGESTGMIPFLAVMDRVVQACKQAGTRRAAYAAYLDISHPEIMEFVEIRKPTGGAQERKCLNIHNAVNITDAFMAKLFADDDSWALIDPHSKKVVETVSARLLWQKILTLRAETGEPYLHFIDTSNAHLPEAQKALGLEVRTSNLCVAPETLLLTKEYGYIAIKEVANEKINVWNGEEWSLVTPRKTGENKELVRVTFIDGTSIECTPEHRFYIQKDYGKPPVMVTAGALQTNDKLEKFNLPTDYTGVDTYSEVDWYSQGFYAGDGNENYDFSWVYAPKAMCIPRLVGSVAAEESYNRHRWVYKAPLPKFSVPTCQSVASITEWLSGLLDADGCVIQSTKGVNIQLTSVNYSFLNQTRLLMQEIGVFTSLTLRREAGVFELPKNDGSGENGEYECNAVWLLNFNAPSVLRLLDLGLNCSRLILDKSRIPNRGASRFLKVQSIETTGRISDTYCATEPKRGRLMFNGVLTGNCSEITLPTGEDRTAVCCLSSVNLEKWDEWKDTDMVKDLIRMLDNVIEVFIKAENVKPAARQSIAKAIYSASRERSLGLGAMGFHSYLQSKMIPFESVEAFDLNTQIFSMIRKEAELATQKLGEEKGSCPDYIDGKGYCRCDEEHMCSKCRDGKPQDFRRNMHLIAIAPNASSSILCGNTSPSIEPYSAVSFSQKTESGTHVFKNKHFLDLLHKKGLTEDEISSVWRSIGAKKGSVQHLDILTQEEKDVFKTAYEIDQSVVVKLAADRQKYIDQAQSVNVFFKTPVDVAELHHVHYLAYVSGLKTLYYCRTNTESSVENIGQKIERTHLTDETKPAKTKTVTNTGYEIACVGCSG